MSESNTMIRDIGDIFCLSIISEALTVEVFQIISIRQAVN